jgi:hypothetical protein
MKSAAPSQSAAAAISTNWSNSRRRSGRPRCRIVRSGLPIEAGEHGEAKTIVVAVALAADLAVAHDQLSIAVNGARHEIVGKTLAGVDEGGAPGELKGTARSAAAQGIGGLPRHARRPRGIGDDPGLGERPQKDADALPGPAVLALVPTGAGVAAGVERLLDQAFGEPARVRDAGRCVSEVEGEAGSSVAASSGVFMECSMRLGLAAQILFYKSNVVTYKNRGEARPREQA